MSRQSTQGWYFQDFATGQTIASPARTVTEADVTLFAGLSGDYNPLHTDAEFARQTPYGGRCGFLEGTVQAFTGLEWKFKKPVYLGDTIHVESTVEKVRALPSMGGGMVVLSVALLNQDETVVQEGHWRLLIKGDEEAQDV